MARDIQKKLEARRLQVVSILEEGEELLAEDGAFALLTTERFIQLNLLQQVKASVPIRDVERLSTTRQMLAKAGPLMIHTSENVLNFGNLFDSDWENFQEVFAAVKAGKYTESAPKQEDPKEDPKVAKTPLVNEKRMEELETRKKFGAVTAEGIFKTKKVTIYSLGFVKVGGLFGGGSIEKLLDIFGESDITKKTGLGRAATAVFTAGLNIVLTPNQRGNLYLSISTPSQTHSLMKEMPTESDLRLMNKLVSAGKAAISLRDVTPSGAPASTDRAEPVGVDQSLERLAKLHKDGLLDESEYKASKAKLLGL